MKWPIVQLLGQDLSAMNVVRASIANLQDCPDAELEIDFSGCFLDYPATSLILDDALLKLQGKAGGKRLTLIVDYELPEPTLLRWIVQGSAVLGLDSSGGLDDDHLKAQLDKYCKANTITVTIRVVNFSSRKEIRGQIYGD